MSKSYLVEFLKSIHSDDYAKAQSNLSSVINEKVKEKMKGYMFEKGYAKSKKSEKGDKTEKSDKKVKKDDKKSKGAK